MLDLPTLSNLLINQRPQKVRKIKDIILLFFIFLLYHRCFLLNLDATQLKQVVFTYMKTKGILKEGETPNPSHYQTLVSKLYSIEDKQEAYESWKSQRSPIDIMLDLATEIQLLDAPWNL